MKNRMFTNLRTAVRLAAVCALGATLFGCGSDSKSDDVISGGVSIDSGIVAMENWEVAGVSQKGPFVKGATVTIQELDGITMGQTGKSFKGDIKSDKGDFAIKKIDLVSQFAMLEASGYYRDEISGKKSSGPVTLKAITDLSNRKTVNINLLTHLEYDRVMNLIEDEEMSITSAKAQAEKEIFEAFGIEGEFVESEDLDISKSGDGNAALLAISVLMQSDVDVAGLTERMASFGDAFGEKGTWNDDDMKTAIADWASEADISGKYSEIRKNVEGWKIGDEVPEFEKYVKNFWWNNYGLGECSKKREGEIGKDENEGSKNYYEKSNVRYICTDGSWQMASGLEMDTEGWAAGDIGEIKAGDVNGDAHYIYDGEKWREASDVEILVGDICLESNEGEVAKVENKESEYYYEKSKVRYICEEGNWKKAGDFEKDTYGWKAGEVGEIKAGDVNKNVNYIYNGKQWREATEVEVLVDGICLESNEGEIKKDYVCKKEKWTEATDYDYDVEGMECVEDGTVVGKKTFMQYVCREGEFVEPYKMRTWFGGRGSAQIHHSLVKNSSTYWYFVTDVYDGLKSKIEWLDGAEDGVSEASLKRCNGICGKVVFDDSKENNIIPYAYLVFDLGNKEYDASELDGLCVAYSASDKITLKMNFSNSHADDVGYALPEYVLPASAEVSVKRVPWASFVAPDWYKGDKEDYGVNGAKSLAGISVQFDRDESSMMTFNIKAIGPYNGNCEDYVKFENK